jgi:hypothetical protein
MLKRLILVTLAGGGALAAFTGALTAVAATSAGASNRVIHLYETSNHGPGAPGAVVITGAINDAGTGYATGVVTSSGTIALSKGSIKDVPSSTFISREQDLAGAPVNPPGCAAVGTITGPVKIVGGTGAYAGITGNVNATYTLAAVLPKLPNGRCNTAHHTRPIGVAILIKASGSVRIK